MTATEGGEGGERETEKERETQRHRQTDRQTDRQRGCNVVGQGTLSASTIVLGQHCRTSVLLRHMLLFSAHLYTQLERHAVREKVCV